MILDTGRLKDALERRGITQATLSQEAGVSRATVAKLVNGRASNVQDRTAQRLARALRMPVEGLDAEGPTRAYTDALLRQHEFLDFTGLGIVPTGQQLSLERGYIDLTVRPRVTPARDAERCPDSPAEGVPAREEALSLDQALVRHRRFFLVGGPGAGKTTALRYLVWSRLQRRATTQPEERQEPVPVFVRLSEWAQQLGDDPSVDLIHAAIVQAAVPQPDTAASWVKEEAATGRVLLLLDGLDEVADTELRGRLIEKIREFVQDYREARVIVTSRPVGFDEPNLGEQFDVLELQPLSTDSIREFCRTWCAFRHEHSIERKCAPCDERLERFRHAIVDHPRIRVLAGNPMMLTMLCLLHDAGAALPQKRYQLYERLTEALLFSWEQKKRTAFAGGPGRRLTLDDREVTWFLESVALHMQRKDMTLAPRWWLLERAVAFLRDELGLGNDEARASADALLWSLHERSGVLAERGPERFGFTHLAFQEHFAARAILSHDDPIGLLQPYLYHPRWREVVRLAAAQLDRRRAPQLLRIILDDPDPTGRFLKRGLLLALGCLADGAPVHERSLLDEIQSAVIELGGSKWFGLAEDATHLLMELGGTRLEDSAKRCAKALIERRTETNGKVASAPLLFIVLPWLEDRDEEDTSDVETDDRFVIALDSPDGEVVLWIVPSGFDHNWAQRVLQQLESDPSMHVRGQCAKELGRFVASKSLARTGLVNALCAERTPSVRESIVRALGDAAGNVEVQPKLLGLLVDANEDPEVRGACADALGLPAEHNSEVRQRLSESLARDLPTPIRVGAVRGLTRCVADHEDIRGKLWALLNSDEEDESVRIAAIWSLELTLPDLPHGVDLLTDLVSRPSGGRMARVAAQIIARYAATDRVGWGKLPIEKTEQVLVSLEDPCQDALDALRALVDAREVRRLGVSREARIVRALSAHRDRVHAMFVFGSAARGEQGQDSDIDLMVIGDVGLRELTPDLKRLEQELGRQVNVVLYTREEWSRRILEGDPFVKQVEDGKKLFVMGGAHDLAAVAR